MRCHNPPFLKSLFRFVAIFGLLAGATNAQENLSGKAWIDMNYGPYATASYETHPGNIAYKGIAVRLDAGEGGISFGNRFVIFDTDTMRYAAAWSGTGFINWRSIVYDGSHGTHPSIVGERTYVNPVGAGWGHPADGRFAEERLVGNDKKPYGPLAHDWAKWKGLYTHGDQVILSYQVGDASILEHPEFVGDVEGAFTRTIQIGPRKNDLVLQVAAPSQKITIKNDIAIAAPEPVAAVQPQEQKFAFDGGSSLDIATAKKLPLMRDDFTIYARIRTKQGGTILAETPQQGDWKPDGQTFFIRGGRVCFDIGWAGNVESKQKVADGKWHDVAVTHDKATGETTFVRGWQSVSGRPFENQTDP